MSETTPIRLSVLDLTPIPSGSSSSDALHNTIDLARHADELGYTRYWLPEHHNMGILASSVPEMLIGPVASATKRLRVGSGGVMLPNQQPLRVAESFRLLEALYPGRIDLGIGRAPGTDQLTALALRGSVEALSAEDFPQQMNDLLGFFSGQFPADHPFRRITAAPAGVPTPDIWLLGSSTFSAQLAAKLGLSFAFAHHISPGPADEALDLYREQFKPSTYLAAPRTMLAVSAIAAETNEEADELASSTDLVMLSLQSGRQLAAFPSVTEARTYPYTNYERQVIIAGRMRMFVGSTTTVSARLRELAARTGVDELMITTMVHDPAKRRQSYTLLAEEFLGVGSAQNKVEATV